jgi:hypothetical protein
MLPTVQRLAAPSVQQNVMTLMDEAGFVRLVAWRPLLLEKSGVRQQAAHPAQIGAMPPECRPRISSFLPG